MFKKLSSVMFHALAAAVVFVAHTGVGVNCFYILYEPEIPESLKHDDC